MKSIAGTLKWCMSKYNMEVYRYGGEEFLGVVWKEEGESVVDICKELAAKLQELDMLHDLSPFKQVTISIGVSIPEESTQNKLEMLIAEADEALYCSKHNGRNRVTFYQDVIRHNKVI